MAYRALCIIDDCERTRARANGLCSMHNHRLERNGDPLTRVVQRGDAEGRYREKVDRRGDDECWPWTATRDSKGYGRLWWGDRLEGAHRIALFLATGRMPSYVMHSCDNPPCCNPAHLVEADHQTNMADMMAKGRHRTTWVPGRKGGT
jgi:hypothetical protein